MAEIIGQRQKPDFLKNVLTVVGIVLLIIIAYALRNILTAVTLAVFLFYILDPITSFLERIRSGKKLTITRPWAAIIAFIIATIFITLLLLIFIPYMIEEIKNFPGYRRQINEVINYTMEKFRGLNLPQEVQDSITNIIEKGLSGSKAFIRHLVQGMAITIFFSQIILLFMVPFLTFYMLIEKESMKERIVKIFPCRYQEEIEQIITESSLSLHGYFTGQLLLGLITWILTTITLWILGVKAALFLGLLAGISKLIPVVGIFFGVYSGSNCCPCNLQNTCLVDFDNLYFDSGIRE
ncbi:MAG: AI-2E family transporter [bacterium]